jgi:hypothetical protein
VNPLPNRVQQAAGQIKIALDQLQLAKANLRHARSDQHAWLAARMAEIEEIYDILTDPTCTPEILEGGIVHAIRRN